MAIKLVVLSLAVFTIVSANEQVKRQSSPDFNEYFSQFQEHMKPIIGGFPNLPNGFGSFPNFPGFGGSGQGGSSGQTGSSGSSSPQFKRQIQPNTLTEWFNKFQENNNFSGNLPFKPPTFGHNPFGGSGTSETTQEEN